MLLKNIKKILGGKMKELLKNENVQVALRLGCTYGVSIVLRNHVNETFSNFFFIMCAMTYFANNVKKHGAVFCTGVVCFLMGLSLTLAKTVPAYSLAVLIVGSYFLYKNKKDSNNSSDQLIKNETA